MSNSQFIKDLKESKFYNLMFEEAASNVIMIYLTGSRLLDVTDDKSDYDIIVLVDDVNRRNESNYFMVYQDKKVHWIIISIDRYLNCDNYHCLPSFEYLGYMQLKNLTDDNIIYKNELYTDKIVEFLNKKEFISHYGCLSVIKNLSHYVNDIYNEGKLLTHRYSKWLYHLNIAYYYYNELEIDKEYLKEIKRIKWQPVQEQYKNKCFETIKWIKENIINKNVF